MTQRANIKRNFYENEAWSQQLVVCGVDEVGRGCLAGPVVTAAVILPPKTRYSLLKDSKTMSEKQLATAAAWIRKNAWFGIGIVPHNAIDEINIYQATLRAMQKSVINLMISAKKRPSAILVDAMPLKMQETSYHDIPVYHFNFGESKSASIAAASIIAKVFRDELMNQYDAAIPGYAFEHHKGYATKRHQNALREKNRSIIHRVSFLKNFTQLAQDDHEHQQTIC